MSDYVVNWKKIKNFKLRLKIFLTKLFQAEKKEKGVFSLLKLKHLIAITSK